MKKERRGAIKITNQKTDINFSKPLDEAIKARHTHSYILNRIFTFWEPRENLPPYLNLCMRTWSKFLPEYEIVFLNYSNLGEWLGEIFFDEVLYKKFSLPQQADAMRCALLRKHGGLWFDVDTVVTSPKIRNLLKIEAEFALIGTHIGFIFAQKEASVLQVWERNIKRNLFLYKHYYKSNKFARLIFRLCRRRSRRYVSRMGKWDFLGNFPLSKALRHADDKSFRSIDRMSINALPELKEMDVNNIDLIERYRSFYFDNDYSDNILKGERGIIMLHNSWTPDGYKKMTEQEFLAQDITLSRLLRKILDI
jgi:mannosyltransferase OCH1-like enzyme